MITKLSKWVVKNPVLIIIITIAILIPCGISYLLTPVNYDILSFLPEQAEPGDIEDSNAVYGIGVVGDSATITVVIMEDLSPKEMDRICNNVNEVEGVASAMWVGSVADIGIPESMYPDVLKDLLYAEQEDGKKSTLMLVQYEPDDKDNPKYDSIAKVNAVREVLNEKCYVFGLPAVMADTKEIIESEMFVYIGIAVGLASIIVLVTTKHVLITGIIMAALGGGVMLNMGTNFVFGSISYLTQAIAAILQMAVTIDYAIILLDRFEEECVRTNNVKKAMARAVKFSFTSLFGGASTTFFGFIALCFMSLTIGLQIGLVMAKGVVFGLLSVLIFMPALVIKFYKQIYGKEHKCFIPTFGKPIDFIIKHKKVFVIIFFVLFVPVYLLNSNVPTYTDLNGRMPPESPSLIASKKLKEDFGIASMNFALVSADLPSSETTQLIDEMEQVDGVGSVVALNSFIGGAIPTDIMPDVLKSIIEKEVEQYGEEKKYTMMAIFGEIGLEDEEEFRAMKNELTKIIKARDPVGCITGDSIMYDELVDIAEIDLVVTSFISIATVALLIAFTFKSILIPIILVAGVQFAIYLNLAVSTVMNDEVVFLAPIVLGCVQLGATIDYAILLTNRFQEELQKGKEKHEAMRSAARAATRSIFQSAMTFFSATIGIVIVGKVELVTDLCVLMARGALISSVVVVCFIMPMLLCFEKYINKTTFGWRVAKEFDFKRGLGFMKKNKKAAKAVLSVFLCLCLTLGFAGCGEKEDEVADNAPAVSLYENTAKSVTKSETVYINMNAMGGVTKTTVTDWIHTDTPEVRVYDVTDLDSSAIQNVKGDTLPVINSNNTSELMWNMNSTDLYYTGTTKKQVPIKIGINYYLNGQPISAEDIAGQSGTVKIEFEFENTYTKAVKINGTTRKMYLPMVVLGGTILPEDHFSAIETENGLSLGDGSNELVGVFSVPGVSESLGIGSEDLEGYGDIQLNNKASITATTDCFELGNMYFAAIPVASLDLDFDASNQVDSLQGALSVLKTLMGSLNNIDIKGLMNALSSNSANLSGLAGVLNDAIYVYESNQVALEKLMGVLTTENMDALSELLVELNKPENQEAISMLTNSGLIQSLMNIQDLANALKKAQPVMQQLSSVMNDPEVQSTLNNLDSTMATLDKLQREIDKNKNLINMLTDLLSDSNLDSIADISTVLANSNVDLSDYGIIVDDTDAFVANCEAWIKVGQEYRIFTDAHDSMSTNVAFIYMTESITHNYEATPSIEEKETTTVSWFERLFG
ncbi:MAG: MMPL family transporter [Clostridia bacterium]|nr:MMPL family transporter [Clostridia bacterium]